MPDRSVQQTISAVRAALKRDGVRRALQILNEQSQHRFTAVFRFAGATLQNIHLIDRHDPTVERSEAMPVLESYCVFVRDTAVKFVTEDSLHDMRVSGHPKQKSVQSYCGVPLFTPEGELFGTICHFDHAALPFSIAEMTVLEDVANDLVAALEAGDSRRALAATHASP